MSNFFRRGLLIVIITGIGYLFFITYSKYQEKKTIQLKVQLLPKFKFYGLDGKPYENDDLEQEKAVILVRFHSECDYCQHEIKEISEKSSRTSEYQILLISSEPTQKIKNFISQYNRENRNFIVLQDKDNVFEKSFGITIVPVNFIYDKKFRLKKIYKGEIKFDVLLKSL